MKRLTRVAYRSLAERKSRALLTGAGIALGVALLFGSLVTGASSTRGLERYVEELTGTADVLISPVGAFDAQLPDGVIATVTTLPEVRDVVGVLALPTVVSSTHASTKQEVNRDPEAVLIGAEREGLDRLYLFRLRNGRFFDSGRQEIVLSRKLATSLQVSAGDRVTVATPRGREDVAVVGILEDYGGGRLNHGGVAFTSLLTAQGMTGRPGTVRQAYVGLEQGADVPQWIARHGRDIHPAVTVESSTQIADFARRQLAGISGTLTALATAILFVAGFLIYLTLSMAVAERVRMYGTLLSLGATRSQIRRIVVVEAVSLGLAATLAGLLIGLVFARGGLALSGRLTGEFDVSLTVPPWSVAAGAALGIITTLLSALVPAGRAARLDPVSAMRGDYSVERRLPRTWMLGAGAFAAGLYLAVTSGSVELVALATLLVTAGSVLLVPPVLRPLAHALGSLTSRLSRGAGRVAVLHLSKERTRSAYTLGLIMVVMAFALAVAAVEASFIRSMEGQLTEQFGADLELRAALTFDPGLETELRRVPGIQHVTPINFGLTKMETHSASSAAPPATPAGPERVLLVFVDPLSYFEVSGWSSLTASVDDAERALTAGGSVIFPEATAGRLRVRAGDRVSLHGAEGPREFTIAALARIPNSLPTLYVSRGDGRAHFSVGNPMALRAALAPGADLDQVSDRIERDLGGRADFAIETVGAIKDDIRAQISGGLNGFFALLFLAGAVGFIGLANTLAVSVVERYREIGLMRAVGARSRQIVGGTLVEAATLVVVAFVLAVPLGTLLSFPLVQFSAGVIGDLTIDYEFPTKIVGVLAAGGAALGAVAAMGPARRASRLEIDAALRYE